MRRAEFSSWYIIEQIPLFRQELGWIEEHYHEEELVVELIGFYRTFEEVLHSFQFSVFSFQSEFSVDK